MITVYKYGLKTGLQTINMPEEAKLLEVAAQDQRVHLWSLVDTDKPAVSRTFFVVLTGGEIDYHQHMTYVGTAHGVRGWLVFHVFEMK